MFQFFLCWLKIYQCCSVWQHWKLDFILGSFLLWMVTTLFIDSAVFLLISILPEGKLQNSLDSKSFSQSSFVIGSIHFNILYTCSLEFLVVISYLLWTKTFFHKKGEYL